MNVGTILRHKEARIISVRMDETVEVAAQLLHREGVGALAVQDICHTEGNTAVGMFSERDLVRAVVQHGAAALKRQVADFTSFRIITCTSRDKIEHALHLMLEHHVRHLPVFEEFTLIGVISMRDVLACLAEDNGGATRQASPRPGRSATDSSPRI